MRNKILNQIFQPITCRTKKTLMKEICCKLKGFLNCTGRRKSITDLSEDIAKIQMLIIIRTGLWYADIKLIY